MKKLTLNGVEYQLPNADNTAIAQAFLDWAKAKLDKGQSPLDVLRGKIDGFTPEIQAMMVKEALAQERTPLAFNSPEVTALFHTLDGSAELVRLYWSYFQKDLTAEKCWELHQQAIAEFGEDFLTK